MKNRTTFKKGQAFGDWKLVGRINQGGNGEVWRVSQSLGSEERAMKILKKITPAAYQRFRDEVKVVKENNDIEGIVPIIDSYLPLEADQGTPWYVMPLAIPLEEHLKNASPIEIVSAFVSISKTLSKLHKKGISHRDIKPGNLLYLEGNICLSDFGLVDYPDKVDVTGKGETVGPKWTMAPEAKRGAQTVNGGKADIYSLCKTMWILLTRNKLGFDGQYSVIGSTAITKYVELAYSTTLDSILAEGTANEPDMRPNAIKFHDSLVEWLEIGTNFFKYNHSQWKEVQETLFPNAIPEQVIWTNVKDICDILNILSSIKSLSYILLPDHGGVEFLSAKPSTEISCIELHTGGTVYIVKPTRLIFQSFGGELQWNYFRLETQGLAPVLDYEFGQTKNVEIAETVVELSPNNYVEYSCWDEGEYEGNPLPASARLVRRYFSGAFVIFQKRSTYNLDTHTSDGRHNTMSAEQFKDYIHKLKQICENSLTKRNSTV